MKKLFYLPVLFTLIFSLSINAQKKDSTEKEKKPKKEKSFKDIITKDAVTDSGLFNVYRVNDKYYYEIPDSLIGRDMLMVTRVSKMSVSIPLTQHKLNEQVLRWDKKEKNILLRESSYVNFANDSLPINQAVINSNFEPIIFKFKIEARNDSLKSSLINVTSLFNSDVKTLGYPQRSRKSRKISSLDTKLSFIESIKSFPKNIEARHVKTYKSSQTESGTVSMEINNSMVLLPKVPMKRRYFDQRVGWITNSQTDYGIDNQEAETLRYLQRWRLEIKNEDIEKFKNGELVEPRISL